MDTLKTVALLTLLASLLLGMTTVTARTGSCIDPNGAPVPCQR